MGDRERWVSTSPSPNARGMMTMTETRAGVDSGSGCVTRSSAAAPEHLPARPQREKQCNDLASLPYSFRCCEDALEDDFTRISGLAGMTTTPLHRASTPRGDRTSYETCTHFCTNYAVLLAYLRQSGKGPHSPSPLIGENL